MNKTIWILLSGALLSLMSGCASMTPEQCKNISPQAQGLLDGRAWTHHRRGGQDGLDLSVQWQLK